MEYPKLNMKCKGTDCPYKNICYRYIGSPNKEDGYAYFKEVPLKDGHCKVYLAI